MNHNKHDKNDFEEEEEIGKLLSEKEQLSLDQQSLLAPGLEPGKYTVKDWYNPKKEHPLTIRHHQPVGANQSQGVRDKPCYECNTLTDEWFKWLLTTAKTANPVANPSVSTLHGAYATSNAFLFSDVHCDTYVYFTTASPFQRPDFRRIVMTKQVPLLVPVYNVVSSPQIFPSRKHYQDKDWVEKDIVEDLAGVYQNGIRATFDGKEFHGCSVIRKKPLEITNIPRDNLMDIPEDILNQNHSTIKIYHGGFWLLIKADAFTSGDHLLSFQAQSKNYEMDVKILINALV
jgi:hypothetical protein